MHHPIPIVLRLPRVRAVLWADYTPWLLRDLHLRAGSVEAVLAALRALPWTLYMRPANRRGRVVHAVITRPLDERPDAPIVPCGEFLIYLSPPHGPRLRRPTLVHGVDEIDDWEPRELVGAGARRCS